MIQDTQGITAPQFAVLEYVQSEPARDRANANAEDQNHDDNDDGTANQADIVSPLIAFLARLGRDTFPKHDHVCVAQVNIVEHALLLKCVEATLKDVTSAVEIDLSLLGVGYDFKTIIIFRHVRNRMRPKRVCLRG